MMKFNSCIKVNGKDISQSATIFIIAEAGVNHNGNMNTAKKLIDIAVEAGADAVKFQTFKAEEVILKDVEKAEYQTKTTSVNETQYDMLKRLEITQQQNIELKSYCVQKKIIFLTTPFDEKSLDELNVLDLPAYKIASTDLTNLPFLKRVAQKNKPIFLSTGMSYLEEVTLALEEIYQYNQDVVLLQCTANYPITDEEANLNVLDTFKEKFDVLLGYSDHTVGVGAAPYAVAKGVSVIEKHFTLDHALEGPDHKASLNPEELKNFVIAVRQAEKYMGSTIKMPTYSESRNRLALQKCFVAKKNILKGEYFTEENLAAKRTGGKGISPVYIKQVLQKRALQDFYKEEIIEI